MNDKKNIDRLFQEKFKDFEATPDPQVWRNIEAELKEKKRRIIPFWLQFSGIAAAFILGIFTLNMAFDSKTASKNTLVSNSKNNTENKASIIDKKDKKKDSFLLKSKQELVLTVPKNTTHHEKEITILTQSKGSAKQKENKNDSTVYQSKNNSPLKSNATPNFKLNSETAIVEKKPLEKTNTNSTTRDFEKKNEGLSGKPDTKIAATDTKKQETTVLENKNELEEILKKKEEKGNVVVNNKNKWQIVPNVAPVYLNTNSAGSALNSEFNNNSKSADSNLSFGIGVNYSVSKKLTLRTGVNKLSLDYNTNNIAFTTSLVANNLDNITYSSTNTIEIRNDVELVSQANLSKNIQKTEKGAINQKMGFYELPLELSYALLNKKFGISVIGGISTFFLNQNETYIRSNNPDIPYGVANNINSIHFSTNFGMGFKYKFVKSFQFNVEPMIKYQVNTFTDNTSTYKPVFIGLYSGLIYSF